MNIIQVHNWHRTVGIVAVFFIILLAVTGLLLNHSHELDLGNRYINNQFLLDWYDISPKEEPESYQVNGNWITRIGERLYFNDMELQFQSSTLLGAVEQTGIIIVAIRGSLLLLTTEGEQVEILSDYDGVPAGMSAIGINEFNELVLKAVHGDYIADINALAWEEYDEIAAEWSASSDISPQLYESLLALYRGKGLSIERVLLDLHSGRIIGPVGVYIIDLAGILFLVLSLTGAWMWMRRKNNNF